MSVKRHISLLQTWYSLKSAESTLFILWTQIRCPVSLINPSEDDLSLLQWKWRNMRWNPIDPNFRVYSGLACFNGLGVLMQTIARTERLRNSPFNLRWTTYWTFWIERRPCSSLDEQFMRFLKNDLSWFNRILLLFLRENLVFFRYSWWRAIKAYLCAQY